MAIKMIKTATAMEIVRKKSNIAPGNGTIIIAKIIITKKTTVRSLDPTIAFKKGCNKVKTGFFALANG